jgi:hypothetical protein
MITPTRDAEIKAPEKTADMPGAQAGDVDLTESGLIEVDRSYVIAELHAHEPCKVNMTILFIENQSDNKTEERSGDQRNGEVQGGEER